MQDLTQKQQPELWGGIECTINRVADRFRDQLVDTGHYTREGDIEKIAGLGIRKLRYPILWEFHQPERRSIIDWSWTENKLNEIREKGIEPIAGLLHHGSGPAFTDLAVPLFPYVFAEYAAKVASKFPWLQYYTPVNEPLTTARFSGLYGFWYPHGKSDLSFLTILLNEVKAIVLAMQEIRKINPDAKLVQTEDLAKIHSSPELEYQAHFENHRRWLTWDLLCGKVDKDHSLWNYFIDAGINEKELNWFLENTCPPDIIGCNYYVTSERWLDDNLDPYPKFTHGSNGRHVYADTEAVRYEKQEGLEMLLTETWERYNIPVAITECHLGCTREEQMRWLLECWQACKTSIEKGIDIKGITAWSLLGAFDWNSLLTRSEKHYETGVFDVSDPTFLRPTAIAKLVTSLSAGMEDMHPLLQEKGWWNKERKNQPVMKKTAPVMLIGKNGTLATAFRRILVMRGIPYVALGREDIDITSQKSIEEMVAKYKPWAVINTAGYVKVDEAETNREECFLLNSLAPQLLSAVCSKHGIRLMTYSSDLVFDGNKQSPYVEMDSVKSLNVYGESKVKGEKAVQKICADALIIRTSSFFGPWDQYNFVYHVMNSLENQCTMSVANNIMISPTYVPDLVNRSLDLFIDEEKGIWHICNDGKLTWYDLAAMVADRMKTNTKNLVATPAEEMNWKAKRPLYSVLESERGGKLPSVDNALERYFQEQIA
jgi:dTDP-4-dehydrorhamnose reductase